MICKWLYQNEGARNVIVFFNGWGVGQEAIDHLTPAKHTDILFVYDYTNLDAELPDLNHYETRHLIAWSFGVGSYAQWQQGRADMFTRKIAVNGTVAAIDRFKGIPAKIVQHTIDSLTVDSFEEFLKRCYGDTYNRPLPSVASIDIETRKNELSNIKNRHYPDTEGIEWDLAWVGRHDQIFPVKNQLRAWQGTLTKEIDAAHAAFRHWSAWQELLDPK